MTSDVAKHRKESAVGELGVIETGLPTKRASQDRQESSCSNADKKLGRASLQKCEVVSRTATLGCYKKKKKNMMAAATPAVQVKNQVILHPLRVDIPVGSITAILGGAGSGKSTLLKFLAGNMDRNVIVEGKGECYIDSTATLHLYVSCVILYVWALMMISYCPSFAYRDHQFAYPFICSYTHTLVSLP